MTVLLPTEDIISQDRVVRRSVESEQWWCHFCLKGSNLSTVRCAQTSLATSPTKASCDSKQQSPLPLIVTTEQRRGEPTGNTEFGESKER
jgi:hypothetical protein